MHNIHKTLILKEYKITIRQFDTKNYLSEHINIDP